MTLMIWSVTSQLSKSKTVVSNATPLIYLAKVGMLHVLKIVFSHICIVREVFQEVCEVIKTPDGLLVSEAVKSGWIEVKPQKKSAKKLAKHAGIHVGEASSIVLAKSLNALLIIDDKMGRTVAEMMGVECIGTMGILLKALNNSLLTLDEFKAILDRMIAIGSRLDVRVYSEIIELAKKISRE